MSEQSNELERAVPLIDCGAVILTYDDYQLTKTLRGLTPANSYLPLARPFISPEVAKHVNGALFGVDHHPDDGFFAKGSIDYDITATYPKRRYRKPKTILGQLQQHLDSTIDFTGCNIHCNENELSIEEGDRAFRIFVDIDTENPKNVTITLEDDYGADEPNIDEILTAATVWAEICDFVVRLRARKHTAIAPDQLTHITVGPIEDIPSDIELALVQEIERRRRILGQTATLPDLDSEDILPDATQLQIEVDALTTEEVGMIATDIINKKRHEYGMFGMMTLINQSDIIDGITETVHQRPESS